MLTFRFGKRILNERIENESLENLIQEFLNLEENKENGI